MPIGTEDDLSSRHCRHSTTHGPSGRWITLGWCGLRTPTSCSSYNALSPSGTLSVAQLRAQKRRPLAPLGAAKQLEPAPVSPSRHFTVAAPTSYRWGPRNPEQEANP
jgi:hypothetical protein